MIRVCEFKMDGLDGSIQIASMNKKQAKEFVEKSRALLDRKETTPEQWDEFSTGVIADSMKRAGNENVEQRVDELDIPTASALYLKILEFSGLRVGEAKAAA